MGQVIKQPNMGKKVSQQGGNSHMGWAKPPANVGGNTPKAPAPNVTISGNNYPGIAGKR